MIDIIDIADKVDVIINGYAFARAEEGYVIINVDSPKFTLVLSEEGKVLETTMDDKEIEMVKNIFYRNKKYMSDENFDEEWWKSLEDICTVKYQDQRTGKSYEVNPGIDDAFWDTYYQKGFSSGDFVLTSGELPDKWKSNEQLYDRFKEDIELCKTYIEKFLNVHIDDISYLSKEENAESGTNDNTIHLKAYIKEELLDQNNTTWKITLSPSYDGNNPLVIDVKPINNKKLRTLLTKRIRNVMFK